MKYHTLFCRKLGKMSQNLASAAVVIDALRVNQLHNFDLIDFALLAYLECSLQDSFKKLAKEGIQTIHIMYSLCVFPPLLTFHILDVSFRTISRFDLKLYVSYQVNLKIQNC